LLVVVAAALFLTLPAQARASTSLQSVVLHNADAPHGCTVAAGQVVSNSYVEKQRSLTPAQVKSYGRITGYGNRFACSGKGITAISSEAVEFAAASGAHRYYALISSSDLQAIRRYKTSRRLSTAGEGQEATGFSYEAHVLSASGALSTFAVVLLRRGRYLGTVEAVGSTGTWNTATVTALARVLDNRLKQLR
jgi:hypothetical protein